MVELTIATNPRGLLLRNGDQLFFLLAVAALIGAIVGYALNRPALRRADAALKASRHHAAEVQREFNTAQQAAAELNRNHQQLATLLKETSTFYPSLAMAISDLAVLEDERLAHYLRTKTRPAAKQSELVREAARARKEAERRAKALQYQLSYYEDAFPWLVDYAGRSTQDLLAELEQRRLGEIREEIEDGDDVIRRFVPPDEYARLSEAERSDLALKRWRESRKTNWQIGRDYERAIGYEFERLGHTVEYFGAVKGLDDLGRDLIAKKDGITFLIQCKYWAQHKEIHEKHVFQLIGTAFEYACNHLNLDVRGLDLSGARIVPFLITNIRLSETATQAAERIGVKVTQEHPLKEYPLIKCNVNGRSRIYHLPFDQQYDTARILKCKGECYVSTAAEAEALGFRRARRHFVEA